jgi:biopolymer transport protein ExbB/TolQ
MNDIITLYTPELLQAFVLLTALLFGANILQAIAAIIAKGRLQETECRMQEAEDGKQAALDMLKHATDKAKRIQAERDMANELRDRCEKTMRAAMDENDRLMIEREEMAKDVKSLTDEHDRLLTERANLYFRNAKGQIQKLS